MSGRAKRLDRLLAMRRLREQLDRASLALASAAVAEVRGALDAQAAALVEAKRAAGNALIAGDRAEWLMADAQSEVAGWNRVGLGVLLRERVAGVAPAMEQFQQSRVEHEQVKRLTENARQAAKVEEDRRAQAAADDWFLSKRVRAAQ